MHRLARPVALALSTLLLALPVAARVAEPPGADSPQALVARLQAAAEAQDLPEMMRCLTPDARREMAAVMIVGAAMMIAFMSMGSEMAQGIAEGMTEGAAEPSAADQATAEEAKRQADAKTAELTARYEGILTRHNVTEIANDESPMPSDPAARSAELARLFAKTDEIALITDLLAMIEELGGNEQGGPRSPVTLPGAVTDYRVEGDRATAKSGEETIRFVRVDGRWYAEPEPAPEPAPEAEPGSQPPAEPGSTP